ncbi:hypothetical protein [Fusobacterium ulcerans]|uniref:Uncharacterized protein n=1 Tax=Fusobacterium ulcerans 12-1B TaxID=457404 RepID=H1PYP3_9FUSO|nr:hypothetical protein [Fusobacterium ulcerans]EHO77232.1 hypothetical protein HMPREF0402_03536 [Fusobacterium ulcerans 12-1B]
MIIKTYEIGEALYEVTYIMEENISNKVIEDIKLLKKEYKTIDKKIWIEKLAEILSEEGIKVDSCEIINNRGFVIDDIKEIIINKGE